MTDRGRKVFNTKFRLTYDEVRIIVMALVELKNQLIAEGRYTDPVDDLLIKFVKEARDTYMHILHSSTQ